MVPVSQGWRAKCTQKEFLKKTGEVDNFKKNDDCKRSEDFINDEGSYRTNDFKVDKFKKNNHCKKSKDFKNDDGSDKTDGFKKTDNFKVDKCKKNNDRRKSKDFKNDDGSDKTDGFKKTDDFRRTEDSKKNDVDFKRNADPRNNGEPEISFELEMNCGPEKHCDLKLTSDQEPMSDLWLLLRYSGIDEIYWSGVWFGEVSWIGEIYLSCEVSWYDWDVEKDELSPGLSELNLSKNRQEKIKLDLETVKIGFSVEKFLMKLFTGPLRCKEWDGILPEEDVTFEGCRFLLQCREWFLVQIKVLAITKIQWSDDRVLRFPKDEDLEYSRVGLSLEKIGEQTWSQSVYGNRSMVHPSGIKVRLLGVDVSSTKPCEIGRRCMKLIRWQRWSLLEWARLNPDLVRAFFVRMGTRWTEDVPFLPGWKHRGGRKRTRSPSRSRPGVEKKRKRSGNAAGVVGEKRSRSTARVVDGFPGVEAYVRSSSQPDPGSPGVWNGFEVQDNEPHQAEEREDVVILNEDELEEEQLVVGPGPSKRLDPRSKLEPRKSLVRPTKKGPPRVENAYEDIDSVFEIPSEVLVIRTHVFS